MYLPNHFTETRTEVRHELMRKHPFAVLVTLDATGLVANHIPMEIDPAAGPLGTLGRSATRRRATSTRCCARSSAGLAEGTDPAQHAMAALVRERS